jgi:altronate hydrolase
MAKALRVDPRDGVATLLHDALAGEVVTLGEGSDGDTLVLSADVGRGQKVALAPIAAGEPVVKYGFPIGTATQSIAPGAHVHSHNLKTSLEGTLAYRFDPVDTASAPSPSAKTFDGYVRADGSVGTRNEIWILSTVGCVARTAERSVSPPRPLRWLAIVSTASTPSRIRMVARSSARTWRARAQSWRASPAIPMPAAS